MGPPAALSRRETRLRYGRSLIMNFPYTFMLGSYKFLTGFRVVLADSLNMGKAFGIFGLHDMECEIFEFG